MATSDWYAASSPRSASAVVPTFTTRSVGRWGPRRLDAELRNLLLLHHAPEHSETELDGIVEAARTHVLESGKSMEVDAAQEGAEVWLNPDARAIES